MFAPKDDQQLQAFTRLQARFLEIRAQIEAVESAPSLETLQLNLRNTAAEFEERGAYSVAMMASPGFRFSFAQALQDPAFVHAALWPVVEKRILELAKQQLDFGLPPKERAARVAALKAEMRTVEIAEEAAATALEARGYVAVRRHDVDMAVVLGEASKEQLVAARRTEQAASYEGRVTGKASSVFGAHSR